MPEIGTSGSYPSHLHQPASSLGRSVASTTRGASYAPGASSIGSAKFIHIRANRTISARSSGSFMHSASDKHSRAFARYALSAAIGTFSPQFSRDPLAKFQRRPQHSFCCDCPICAPPLSVRYDRPVIDARAPPADPAAGRKQRRRMSSVTLPQASAGAALFGRAVLGPLDDASQLVPPRGTFPGRLRVAMSTMRQWGICSGGVAISLRGKDSHGARSDRPASF
jgi:hypothetical protein